VATLVSQGMAIHRLLFFYICFLSGYFGSLLKSILHPLQFDLMKILQMTLEGMVDISLDKDTP
jgi:Mg2+/citrate symporter